LNSTQDDPVYRQELEDFLRGFLGENDIIDTTQGDFIDTILDSQDFYNFIENVNTSVYDLPDDFVLNGVNIA